MSKRNHNGAAPRFWSNSIATILTLTAGILLTLKPDILEMICVSIGTLLVLCGIAALIGYFVKRQRYTVLIVYAVLFMVVGGLLTVVPSLLKFLIPIFFGAWLLTSSASGMYNNYMLRQVHPFWWFGVLLCAAGALIGVYVITRPATIMESTVRLIAVAMIVHSVLRLASVIFSSKYQKLLFPEQEIEVYQDDEPEDGIIETTIKE